MRLLDFFFAMRPLVLIPAWSFFLLGLDLSPAPGFPALRLLLLSVVLASSYLVNQVIDAESDRLNDKGFFLQRRIFTPRLYVAAAILGLGASLLVAGIRRESPGLLSLAAALGLAYSVPPLRLAGRPGFDLLANAAGYGGVAVLLGAGPLSELGGTEVLKGSPWGPRLLACMLAVAAVFLHTTILDLEGDRRTGKRTSGVALGAGRTRALAALCGVGGAVAALAAAAPVLLGATVLLALGAIAAWLQPRRVGSGAIGVGGTALFALAAGVAWPAYPLALLVLVALTRSYYRRRFDLPYPALHAPNEPATPPRH
jgi:chlorophyll synthase